MEIQKNIANIKNSTSKERELLAEKEKADQTSTDLFSLVKYMIDENRRTTIMLKGISDGLARLESGIRDTYYDEEEIEDPRQVVKGAREIPVSALDAEIIKCVQTQQGGMACADDVKKQMNYKGRNAASVRLNRLAELGILDRKRLGRKVYYKYDAGKATDTLIVSPPQ